MSHDLAMAPPVREGLPPPAASRRSLPRDLLRSWLLQDAGWHALDELAARILLESGVLLLLLASGIGAGLAVLGWAGFHTFAWLLLYGGVGRIWALMGRATDVRRIRAHLDRVARRLEATSVFGAAFLCGSGARGALNEASDIDVCVVPRASVRSRLLGIPYLWALRAESVLRGIAMEALWLDRERYLPFRMGRPWRVIARRGAPEPPGDPLASRGILVALSGMDGSGKTTAAKGLEKRLRSRGLRAVYLHGQRPIYALADGRITLSLAFRSVWRHLGRIPADLSRHPRTKAFFDALVLIDYLRTLRTIAGLRGPGTVVIVDRYVPDVVAYFRSVGPSRRSLEGLLAGISPEPDVGVYFDVRPSTAYARKEEQGLADLERFGAIYETLARALDLRRVDADRDADVVLEAVERMTLDAIGRGARTAGG